eukprot:m.159782 g.159782  ORF g.159782 m.159782 type:complete len:239 (+) comp13377_c2_seq2:868-1584(+)
MLFVFVLLLTATTLSFVVAGVSASVERESYSLADYPPAPGSGNATCSINAQCGIPAANCPLLRDSCISLTGSCKKKRCVCAMNMYGCSNCHAKAVLVRDKQDPSKFEYTTKLPMMDGSGREVNICKFPQGGSTCKVDSDCGNVGGLCLGHSCVCPDAYMCGDCTVQLNDVLYGWNCTLGPSGGGLCTSSKECNSGTCLMTIPGQPGFCQCNPLYACAYCNARVQDVVSGKKKCGKKSN